MLKVVIFCFAFLSSFVSHATLISSSVDIDDAIDPVYVTYANLDWAWVSPVNEQFWGCPADIVDAENYLVTVLTNSGCDNQLLAPEYREGWRYATSAELDILYNQLGFLAFMPTQNTLIQAASYWNTSFTHVDTNDFIGAYIKSEWGNGSYETFYVRDSQQVPEPSTLMIFALGLITLVSRKKLFC